MYIILAQLPLYLDSKSDPPSRKSLVTVRPRCLCHHDEITTERVVVAAATLLIWVKFLIAVDKKSTCSV